jgi:hypothetical protein
MDHRDQAFLEDIRRTISLNHIVAARALWQSLDDPGSTAVWAIAARYNSGPITVLTNDVIESFRDEVIRRNDIGRVSGILMAKLYAELMATYEDLGAFCLAIRERNNTSQQFRSLPLGIFGRYLGSRTNAGWSSRGFKRWLVK